MGRVKSDDSDACEIEILKYGADLPPIPYISPCRSEPLILESPFDRLVSCIYDAIQSNRVDYDEIESIFIDIGCESLPMITAHPELIDTAVLEIEKLIKRKELGQCSKRETCKQTIKMRNQRRGISIQAKLTPHEYGVFLILKSCLGYAGISETIKGCIFREYHGLMNIKDDEVNRNGNDE